ncbi:MAG: hypothetical protein JXA42_10885 [Anaerolineales bacterium]|nr:hypothetical protein [Anaerolineales bacterium]
MNKPASILIWICRSSLIVGLLTCATIISGQPLSESEQRYVEDQALEQELERLVNLERTTQGIPPLKHNQILTESARAHNQDMIDKNYVGHTGSDGSGPPERACARGYVPYSWGDCFVGENINAGHTTPAQVLEAWLNSEGHLENLLNTKYREFGVGHTTGGSYGHYWTLDLGTQPYVLPIFINDDDEETSDRSVIITLTYEGVSSYGSLGPIIWMRISEDPLFPNASWQLWTRTKPFTLSSGNGVKTVYVDFFDGIDHAISSDSILLNMEPTLTVAPQSIHFLVKVNTANVFPKSASIYVDNLAGDPLEWQAVGSNSWLSLDNPAGNTPSTMEASLDLAELDTSTLGVFPATITITTTLPAVVNSPIEIPISARVVEEIYFFYLPAIKR